MNLRTLFSPVFAVAGLTLSGLLSGVPLLLGSMEQIDAVQRGAYLPRAAPAHTQPAADCAMRPQAAYALVGSLDRQRHAGSGLIATGLSLP